MFKIWNSRIFNTLYFCPICQVLINPDFIFRQCVGLLYRYRQRHLIKNKQSLFFSLNFTNIYEIVFLEKTACQNTTIGRNCEVEREKREKRV